MTEYDIASDDSHDRPAHGAQGRGDGLAQAAAARRKRIASFMARGEKLEGTGMLGLELEHCIVRKVTHAPVTYYEEDGIADILSSMAPHFDEAIHEGESLIGFACPDYTVTIEPAGQIEISVAPKATVSEMADAYAGFREILDESLDEHGAEALEIGYNPSACALDLPLIPKERYRIMDARFRDTGSHGPNMMRATQSTQVSVDFTSEADARQKYRAAALLGPLFSFLCDNAPIFEGDVAPGRMMRTHIWDDVDPERCSFPTGVFSPAGHAADGGWGYLDYADWILSHRPLLVMEGERTINCGLATADEHYGEHDIDEAEAAHLLSMFFPDVRLKRYVEIRMADSLPIRYALSYAALIKGLFYDAECFGAVGAMLGISDADGAYANPQFGIDDIAAAKQALEKDSYLATVYGMPAWQLLDNLVALAWKGLPQEERAWLEPLAGLVEHRTTLFDDAFAPDESCTMAYVEDAWIDTVKGLQGDQAGVEAAYGYLSQSTGIYHGEPVAFGYVPRLVPPLYMRAFDRIAQTTHSILTKVTDAFRDDAGIRKLFGFPTELEQLCLMDSGYSQRIPICRLDIFLDEAAGIGGDGDLAFKFCEFNTDGTSAMNEDREVTNALLRTPAYAAMSKRFDIVPQTLFDPWVRSLASIYSEYPGAIASPHVAIVDFLENGSPTEFEEFRKRFEFHGMPCSVIDIRDLSYADGRLCGPDGAPIDCVYRRAVTGDIADNLDASAALIDAVADGSVCMIGGFETQVAHSKTIFRALHSPLVFDILDDEEAEFVERHVPYTVLLGVDDIDLDEVRLDKDRWIIKPVNSYGSKGAFAGRDWSEDEWTALLDEHMDDGYVIQRWCDQYASANMYTSPSQIAAARESGAADKDGFVQLNNMIGLFIYDGRLAGLFTRAGASSIIAGQYGGQTLASMIVHEKRNSN